MTEKKRKSKSGALRTEVFAMRLDPKLKYLAEIAARKQRRSLANFIEWTIENALEAVLLNNSGISVSSESTRLWALSEADRLIKLATYYPDLMTYDEQLIWRVIQEHIFYEKDLKVQCKFIYQDGTEEGAIDNNLVRDCWPEIKAYALGTGTKEDLNNILSLTFNPY
tara:strand:+ start:649 stop:1149 length:501 start_codon:yes stop_codon:yes gene_type:complete